MECPHLPSINYAQFGERLHDKALANRIPLHGSFELTFRCNLRCGHCYCNLPLNDKGAVEKELSTEEVFSIFDQIAEAGCLWLLITGGEPLLRKDFLEIYTYAKKKGFLISLFTNGTLLTPEIADYLAEWPPNELEITLYGVTEKTYEKITRIPGSFRRCKKGIDLLLKRRVPLKLKTIAMTLNHDEIFKIKEYAEGLGVKFRFDPELNSRLDHSKAPCDFRLPPEEVLKLDLADEKRVKAWQEFCERFVVPPQSNNLYVCGAGVSLFHIDPYGELNLCMMSRNKSFSLRHGSFHEGWNEFLPQFMTYKPKKNYKCTQCELLALCSQCPGWAWVENGDLETPVEYLCQITHLRAEEFVPEKSKNEEV